MNVLPHSAVDLEKIYQRRFAGAEDHRCAVWRVLSRDVFSKWIGSDSSVLDLGAGYCEFINPEVCHGSQSGYPAACQRGCVRSSAGLFGGMAATSFHA